MKARLLVLLAAGACARSPAAPAGQEAFARCGADVLAAVVATVRAQAATLDGAADGVHTVAYDMPDGTGVLVFDVAGGQARTASGGGIVTLAGCVGDYELDGADLGLLLAEPFPEGGTATVNVQDFADIVYGTVFWSGTALVEIETHVNDPLRRGPGGRLRVDLSRAR